MSYPSVQGTLWYQARISVHYSRSVLSVGLCTNYHHQQDWNLKPMWNKAMAANQAVCLNKWNVTGLLPYPASWFVWTWPKWDQTCALEQDTEWDNMLCVICYFLLFFFFCTASIQNIWQWFTYSFTCLSNEKWTYSYWIHPIVVFVGRHSLVLHKITTVVMNFILYFINVWRRILH